MLPGRGLSYSNPSHPFLHVTWELSTSTKRAFTIDGYVRPLPAGGELPHVLSCLHHGHDPASPMRGVSAAVYPPPRTQGASRTLSVTIPRTSRKLANVETTSELMVACFVCGKRVMIDEIDQHSSECSLGRCARPPRSPARPPALCKPAGETPHTS